MTSLPHMPLVSVIVPMYGVEAYIARGAESLFAQRYPAIEFIFVDDGGKDAAVDILRGIVSAQVPVLQERVRIISKENEGLPQARKTGLDAAMGEYVLHVDSDDWLEPEAVEKLVRKAVDTEADMVVFDFWKEYASRRKLDSEKDSSIADPTLFRKRLYTYDAYGYVWNKFCRRSLYDVVFLPRYAMHEDIVFSTQTLYRARKIVHLKEGLYHYDRTNVHSATRAPKKVRRGNSSRNMMDLYLHYKGQDPSPVSDLGKVIFRRTAWIGLTLDRRLFDEYPFLAKSVLDFRRLRYFTRVAVSGHLANWLWRSRLERRQVRGDVIRRAAQDYLQPYGAAVRDVREEVPDHSEPRRVFSMWLQGEAEAPPLVRACLDSIRTRSGVELVILDGKSVFDWIDLPRSIVRKWKEGKMKPAHFADICRVELLYRYGGIWMDATDYLDAPLPEWLWEADFFVYQGGDTLKGAYGGIQNCFIRGAKGAYLLKVWRDAIRAYWEAEKDAVDYFVHQLLFGVAVENNPRAASLYASMPSLVQDPTHVLWFRYADEPFDEDLLHRICAEAVFQKTDYKSAAAQSPVPGSFADHLLRPYR